MLTFCLLYSIFLSKAAALSVPAVIINLTRRRYGGIGEGGFEGIILFLT
jgi:hypothetical protein